MMGRTHALSGALAFGGVTLAYPMGWQEVLVAGSLAVGASMLPDIDHHGATTTRSMGPVSWLIHKAVGVVFGPHRWGTHSFAFVGIVGVGSQVALTYRHTTAGLAVLSLMMALAWISLIRLFRISGWVDDIIPIPASVALVYWYPVDLSTVPVALAFGCLVHTLGDCLTDRGCPVLWPLSKKKYGIDLFTTGKLGESVISVVFVVGIVVIAGTQAYYALT